MDTKARLLEALKAAIRSKQVDWPEVISSENWNEFFKLAGYHKVLPMVYEAVYNCPSVPIMPFRTFARQQIISQTIKTVEFLQLYAKLRKAGVEALIVKGLVCQRMYPNPDARISGDEDLLVPAAQFELADQVLLNAGMERFKPNINIETAYEISYGKPNGPLHIELHKSLFPPNASYGDFNRFFSRIHQNGQKLCIQGTEVLAPNFTDHMLYLILHVFVHFLHSGFGIRQVCDIALFGNANVNEIDWEYLHRCLSEVHTVPFTAAIFAIGQQCFDIPIPNVWPEVDPQPLLDDLLFGGIYGAMDMERKHSSSITMNAISTKKRLKLLRAVFPTAESLKKNYPELEKNRLLLPLVWCKRLLRYRKQSGFLKATKTIRIGQQRMQLLKYYGIIDSQ